MKVTFQGDRGSYSEEAALRFFNASFESVPLSTFSGVYDAVENGRVERGIIPIENSLVGSIHQNYDLLLKHHLKIVGEQNLRIVHNLIAHPGSKLEELTEVHSHPVALGQCQDFLDSHPQLTPHVAYDTAGAVKMIKEKSLEQAGAIAGSFAAEQHGMAILSESIQDEPDNHTRFLILSKDVAEYSENAKTSIVFALKNLPGVLFKALSVFALRDLDLTKIESRPLRKKMWQYYFYLDFVGHVEDEAAKNAIGHLREITTFLKILGSYPTSPPAND
jgi:prephenate dehydratase